MAGINNNFSNNDVGDIGSHNKITVSAAFFSASRTAITLIASFVLIIVGASIIYTAYAFTGLVEMVVPLIVGFVVLIGIIIGVNLVIRHIARTAATVSHARAQKYRNALLGASENFVVMRDPKTGEIDVRSVTQKHANYHYGLPKDSSASMVDDGAGALPEYFEQGGD